MFLKGKFLGQLRGRGAPNRCSQRSLVDKCARLTQGTFVVCRCFYDNFSSFISRHDLTIYLDDFFMWEF